LNCSFVRSCLQRLLDGTYAELDGLICTNTCDHARRLYDVVRQARPLGFVHLLSVPHKVGDETTARWFAGELARLKDGLERAFDVAVSDEALRHTARLMNETRGLLRQIYGLRQADAPPLSGTDALRVVTAGAALPRAEYHRLLTQLLDELAGRQGRDDHRARLLLAGSGGCDQPGYLERIEEAGGLIVADSLCFGSRSFWTDVDAGDEPWLELARSYLRRPGCANMTDGVADRLAFIEQLATEFAVDGVLFQRLRYCDLWGGQLLYVRRALQQAELPLLSLEREYALGAAAQLSTRVQAFLESIEGR
jgi:benzoyl-CoA reductase/2-hydroxyglutaryl-CoA dehydratase subunit BcrC/BadD/HgdB